MRKLAGLAFTLFCIACGSEDFDRSEAPHPLDIFPTLNDGELGPGTSFGTPRTVEGTWVRTIDNAWGIGSPQLDREGNLLFATRGVSSDPEFVPTLMGRVLGATPALRFDPDGQLLSSTEIDFDRGQSDQVPHVLETADAWFVLLPREREDSYTVRRISRDGAVLAEQTFSSDAIDRHEPAPILRVVSGRLQIWMQLLNGVSDRITVTTEVGRFEMPPQGARQWYDLVFSFDAKTMGDAQFRVIGAESAVGSESRRLGGLGRQGELAEITLGPLALWDGQRVSRIGIPTRSGGWSQNYQVTIFSADLGSTEIIELGSQDEAYFSRVGLLTDDRLVLEADRPGAGSDLFVYTRQGELIRNVAWRPAGYAPLRLAELGDGRVVAVVANGQGATELDGVALPTALGLSVAWFDHDLGLDRVQTLLEWDDDRTSFPGASLLPHPDDGYYVATRAVAVTGSVRVFPDRPNERLVPAPSASPLSALVFRLPPE